MSRRTIRIDTGDWNVVSKAGDPKDVGYYTATLLDKYDGGRRRKTLYYKGFWEKDEADEIVIAWKELEEIIAYYEGPV